MRAILLFTAVALSACSVVKPLEDVTTLASAARISDQIKVTSTYRWVLPALSEIKLRSSDARHTNHLIAAREGLSESFRLSDSAPWQLLVHWPEQGSVGSDADTPSQSDDSDSPFWRVDLLPLKDVVPVPAHRARLIIDVVDATGEHWVQRLEVEVKPWWFGDDWHEQAALSRAFAAAGRKLTGS